MKRKITFLLLVITLGFQSFSTIAQQNKRIDAAKEKIEAAKIGFFTKQLALTPAEAKLFWPEYELYQQRLEQQKLARRNAIQQIDEPVGDLSDNEINQLIDNRLQQAIDALKARTEFITAIRKILPPQKVVRYFVAEDQFKKRLLERLEQRKQQTERPLKRFRN